MDAAAHYRHLQSLGRDEFLAAAAPAVLVRYRAAAQGPAEAGTTTVTLDRGRARALDAAVLHGRLTPEPLEMELYPLAKKPGASFPGRITIGRTANNDVVVVDHSVSRLHAYVRQTDTWVVADAGSKNGTWLNDAALEPRREAALPSGAVLRMGDVQLMFYLATELFDLLGGLHGRR